MSLAVASLSSSERGEVLAAMRYATARLESRLSPLGEDLGEGDPIAELQEALSRYLPVLDSARAFEAGRWKSEDLDVAVAESCPRPRSTFETCVSLWDSTQDRGAPSLTGRARFFAWSVSHATVVELPSRQRVSDCAEALRDRRRRDGSIIALVLTNEDLALREVPERGELQSAARRLGAVMAASHRHDPQRLEALGRATPTGRVAPWLSLSENAVLVVPRLSKLAHIAELPREIEGAAPCSFRAPRAR